MRMKLFSVAGISICLFLFAACRGKGPQDTASQKEDSRGTAQITCSDRACMEQYVDRYMDAMLVHEVSPTLFAKDCRFTENGVRLPLGDEGLWASMVGKGPYKFYVPDLETQQVAFIGTAREEPMKPGIDPPSPVAIPGRGCYSSMFSQPTGSLRRA